MSSYTVQFPRANMTHAEKERAALTEAMDYLSAKQRDVLCTQIRSKDIRHIVRTVRFCCMVAGVRGYWPVRALTRMVLQLNFPGKFELK